MMNLTELLYKDSLNPLSPSQKETVENIMQSGAHMLDMIEELLNISRFQTGKLKLIPSFFDAHTSANISISNLKALAVKKGVDIINNIDTGHRMYGDPRLIGKTLHNLLSNSIKFCKQGDTITLYAVNSPMNSIAVEDTGTGINKKILSDIFKHEIRTTMPGTARERGTGLGLPYCKDILDAHGGNIRVETEEGVGSIFFVDLPYVKPRIMVVEDNKTTLKLLLDMLKSLDAHTVGCDSGDIALEMVENDRPHLILLDLIMPKPDGLEVLESLRKNQAHDTIPVIVITADTGMEAKQNAFRLGADDFVIKPTSAEDLLPRIRKHII
jgi:CheY-like chemotaxis protein